ncbi:MAG: iron-sulfur cluster repair di-iron protein [Bacteroidetes bacterium]|nr:iron-sulfur cluster repair di-iron protein [Bacteroidota bacterium]
MNNLLNKTVGEIVVESYKTAEVFKKYGIDFCCGGKVSLREVCQTKNIATDEILSAIQSSKSSAETVDIFRNITASKLCEYIVEKHHQYVNENIEIITPYATKVARVHGERHPELVEIARLFLDVCEELNSHMFKEENILFPYIMNLENSIDSGQIQSVTPFRTVADPIRMMETEHESAGEKLRLISQLSHNYQPPDDACNTYVVLLAKLEEFENDLHTHVHLENNLLFPMAQRLEEEYKNSVNV